MDKKYYSRSDNVEEKPDNRQPKPTRRNMKKQYQGTRSATNIKERRWNNMGTRQDCLWKEGYISQITRNSEKGFYRKIMTL